MLRAWLGIATLRRFPRIWAVLHRQFPGEHSSFSQVRCVCHSATPAWRSDCPSIIGQVFPELRVRFLDPQSALSVVKLPWQSHLRLIVSFFSAPDRGCTGVERRVDIAPPSISRSFRSWRRGFQRYAGRMAQFGVQQSSINMHHIGCVALRSASRLRARCAWGVYRTVRGKTQARGPATPGEFAGLL